MTRISRLLLPPLLALGLMGQAEADTTEPAIEVEPVPPVDQLRSEAFVAAQYSLISGAAAAVDRVTARFTSGSGGLADLEKQRDEKLAELNVIDRQFSALIEQGAADDTQRRALTEKRRAVRAEIDDIEARISEDFPQYFELTRPKPLEVREAQALLNEDEAMLMVLVSDDASYIWGITRDKADWARSETLSTTTLAEKVKALRASMEVDQSRGRRREPAPDTAAALEPQAVAFDRKLAHELYRELIAPLEPVIGDKQVLLTNVTGALTSLPLALLVTEEPSGDDRDNLTLVETKWLSDRFALAELPSVSSLRALRCLLISSKAAAHPGCSKIAISNNHARAVSGDVVLAGYGAPTLLGGTGATRAIDPEQAGDMYDGKLADTEKLRQMAYLDAAKAELERLGQQFGKRAAIIIGDDATETAVKQSEVIPRSRFLVFSTHGLLATEVGDNAEPGLVFTPPPAAQKSELDDGLLTASEAAQLRIAADLVVLSACNTAAGDGKPGAEGLSGLARAFFFAGARSMLVSHWAVSDQATSLLMQQTFANIEDGDIAGRARALQAAMKAVREGGSLYQFASPKYWAAFTLVGEPGA